VVIGLATGGLAAWIPRGPEQATWTHAGLTWMVLFSIAMAWLLHRLPVRQSWLLILTGSGTAALVMGGAHGIGPLWQWWAIQSALWGCWLFCAALCLTAAATWCRRKPRRWLVPVVLALWYPLSWLLCFHLLDEQPSEEREGEDASGRAPAISPKVIAPVIICRATGPSSILSYSYWGSEWIFHFYRPLNVLWFQTLGRDYYDVSPAEVLRYYQSQ